MQPSKFSFSTHVFGTTLLHEMKNNTTGEAVSFFPSHGAMLHTLQLKSAHSDEILQFLDFVKDSTELENNPAYKGAVLFPFPNRIEDGRYRFNNQEHQLPINDAGFHHALHGFCYNKPFAVIDQRCSSLLAETELTYEENGLSPGYPFKSSLHVKYTLSSHGKFICSAIVKNTDDKTIPAGLGFHPYFKIGKTADQLLLKVRSDQVFIVNERMIPIGKIPNHDFTEYKAIGNMDLKHCYILDEDPSAVTTEIKDPESNVTIVFGQETGPRKFNYLQLYVPPDRQSVAVEPQTCAANGFNNSNGLIHLEPKSQFEVSWSVSLT